MAPASSPRCAPPTACKCFRLDSRSLQRVLVSTRAPPGHTTRRAAADECQVGAEPRHNSGASRTRRMQATRRVQGQQTQSVHVRASHQVGLRCGAGDKHPVVEDERVPTSGHHRHLLDGPVGALLDRGCAHAIRRAPPLAGARTTAALLACVLCAASAVWQAARRRSSVEVSAHAHCVRAVGNALGSRDGREQRWHAQATGGHSPTCHAGLPQAREHGQAVLPRL